MSYSASDLQNEVDQLLDRLDLEITGDDVDGYTIRHAGRDLATSRGTIFDTAAEATATALDGLVDLVEDLISASKVVVERWSTGDLAEAVRELDVCARSLDGSHARPEAAHKAADRRIVRLGHLAREGLRFSDCVCAFGVTSSQAAEVATARRLVSDCTGIQVPLTTVVKREPDGTAVMAWVDVSNDSEARDQLR